MPDITLTFDNGPTPGVTERVLDVLAERGLKATFFVIGNKLQTPQGRALAEYAQAQGHWIGNHTMNHGEPLGIIGDPAQTVAEISETQLVLGHLGEPQRLFRPTGHGSVGPHLLSVEAADYLSANKFTIALWTLFVRDSKFPDGWVDRALDRLTEREHHVLVVHDLPTGAMDDLPRFLDTAASRGYTFVQDFPTSSTPMRSGYTDKGFDHAFVSPPRSPSRRTVMARINGAETRNHLLYLDIRRNLLLGRFPPGHRFKLTQLCTEHGASVSVVREALTRLSGQGLVVLEPNKGFSVASLTDAEINDVAFLRSEIESLAVRRSIELGDLSWEAGVVAAHHQLSETPNATLEEDPEANELWTAAHRAFHEACAAGCGSPRLLAFRAQLYDQSEIIRQMAKLRQGTSRDVAAEHAAIAEAVVSRNGDVATRLLHHHIDTTRQACLHSLARDQSGT